MEAKETFNDHAFGAVRRNYRPNKCPASSAFFPNLPKLVICGYPLSVNLQESSSNQTMKSERRPPFSDVPRRWLNIAAVVGGVLGLLISQLVGWSDVQVFVMTLGLAGGCVLLTVLVHRALKR